MTLECILVNVSCALEGLCSTVLGEDIKISHVYICSCVCVCMCEHLYVYMFRACGHLYVYTFMSMLFSSSYPCSFSTSFVNSQDRSIGTSECNWSLSSSPWNPASVFFLYFADPVLGAYTLRLVGSSCHVPLGLCIFLALQLTLSGAPSVSVCQCVLCHCFKPSCKLTFEASFLGTEDSCYFS